jgi:EmrB/QacA subfamily drug resistance transporter
MDYRKRYVVIGLMVAMFLGAVEGTVVTTAIPTIVKELNGFELISWIFSAYLLTTALSTPIYGKLSDLYGRKTMLSIGIIIFLIGSSFCGLAQNMYQLVGFRALQGLGTGAIFTITYTIVGDIFTLTERAKVQGWLGTVWGVASLAGPFLGGFLIDVLSWHWIFFINIPFGVISILLLQKNLIEDFEKKKHKIDYAGTAILSMAILTLLYGILLGEKSSRLLSPPTIIALIASAILLTAFYFIEKKAMEPIIPFEIFKRASTLANIISFLVCAILIGENVYMPIYIQNVLGFSATISGLALAPMTINWTISSIIVGKAIPKYGERMVVGMSILFLFVSSILLATLRINSSLILVIVYTSIMGLGFGACLTTVTIIVQDSIDYSKRGAATATNSLLRTLGQTIGISIFGSIFNLTIIQYFNKLGVIGIDPNNLYALTGQNAQLSIQNIKLSITSGLHGVFINLILIGIICLAFSFRLSNGLKESAESYQIN